MAFAPRDLGSRASHGVRQPSGAPSGPEGTMTDRSLWRGSRRIKGNIQSELLPGGSLISAILDRRLMMWSDRGGASRHFGDRWSEQCAAALDSWIGTEQPLQRGDRFRLEAVIRLDSNPQIAIQAGRHKLVNPDFVLYGQRTGGRLVVRAADAKFAVDTIKPTQVSAEALEALLAVEGGLVRETIEEKIDSRLDTAIDVETGVFVSPISPLTDFLLPRVTAGPRARIHPDDVILIPVDPVAMFRGLPMTPLIGRLACLDHLPVSPRENILSAMYYFRVACACFWMWAEEHAPILSLEPAPSGEIALVGSEVERRSRAVASAFDLVSEWVEAIEEIIQARRAFYDVARMPVTMRELRAMVDAAGRSGERGLLRQVRAILEQQYRQRVVEEVGEIPSRPSRPLADILLDVAQANKRLYPELKNQATDLVSNLGRLPAGG